MEVLPYACKEWNSRQDTFVPWIQNSSDAIPLNVSSDVVESTALVVWLRRQVLHKAPLFNNSDEVADFVKYKPLVIVGFFQVQG